MRSALDELRSEDLEMASEEELGEGPVELERASRVLEAERSRRLVEVERRSSWAVDGHLSVVSWAGFPSPGELRSCLSAGEGLSGPSERCR